MDCAACERSLTVHLHGLWLAIYNVVSCGDIVPRKELQVRRNDMTSSNVLVAVRLFGIRTQEYKVLQRLTRACSTYCVPSPRPVLNNNVLRRIGYSVIVLRTHRSDEADRTASLALRISKTRPPATVFSIHQLARWWISTEYSVDSSFIAPLQAPTFQHASGMSIDGVGYLSTWSLGCSQVMMYHVSHLLFWAALLSPA
jgi:hypothetical protein